MKTQIIKLDSHDDVTSIRDKMSWAKTERILLIFPRRLSLLTRNLDLLLLRRHAAGLGAQLAIVARSNELRRVAKEVGLPVFATAAKAQREVWEQGKLPERPRRRAPTPDLHQMRNDVFPSEPRWRSNSVLRITFFVLAILAILSLLAIFFPSATISLTPATHLQSLTFPVSAGSQVTAVNLAGSLPARSVSAVVERKGTLKVSGTATLPDAIATGLVRFRNLTTGKVSIPAGTIVSTTTNPPVRFATTSEAVLAAGVGKTGDVPVQAVVAGTSGNLPPDALVAFETDLGAGLAVTNPDPTAGGSDQIAPIQTATDRSRLRASLVADLLEECKSTLPQMLTTGDIFFPGTLSVAQVFNESYFPAEDQPGELLSLTLNLQCQAQYATGADLESLASMTLDAILPEGFTPLPGGAVAITNATTPVVGEDGLIHWDVQAQRLLQAQVDPLTVMQLVLGHKPDIAAQRLSTNLPLAGTPVITVTPSWWPWMPLLPLRITLTPNR